MLLQGQLERLPSLAYTEAIMLGWTISHHPFEVILTFSPIPTIFTIYTFIFQFSHLITLHSPFVHLSFPGPHFTLLYCPSTGPIFHFPLLLFPYFLSTNPQLVLSFLILYFISLHSSSLLFTPQAYVYAHTHTQPCMHTHTHSPACMHTHTALFPFCSSNSSFQNMTQYLCHDHSAAICTCLPCIRPFCLPWWQRQWILKAIKKSQNCKSISTLLPNYVVSHTRQ
jgi:hypothetical protein